MNLLIVDDQSTVVNSLKEKLEGRIGQIGEIFTATSAEEAKLIMMSFSVQILFTDIEMPEENGLSLLKWTLKKYPDIVGVLLTSHADFSYAKEAIKLGGFDYILQPARLEEIEDVLLRAAAEVQKRNRFQKIEETGAKIRDQQDLVMELFLINAREGNNAECEKLYKKLMSLFDAEFEHCVFWTAQIKIVRFGKKKNTWEADLLKLVFRNVLEELFEEQGVRVQAAKDDLMYYYLAAAAEEGALQESQWRKGMEYFTAFLNSHMDFQVAVFANPSVSREYDVALHRQRTENAPGIYWNRPEAGAVSPEEDDAEIRIRKAQSYIRENLSRSISRSEVAEYLHINEDYFGRTFKKYTGYTFKDYDNLVRMETAKNLLEKTRLPVSMIAEKVGFDNFSHFSQAFRKYSGKTPSEYR